MRVQSTGSAERRVYAKISTIYIFPKPLLWRIGSEMSSREGGRHITREHFFGRKLLAISVGFIFAVVTG